jgi:hypothetical protein
MNTSEVLNRAADLIEERGWTTGNGWPGTGNYKGPLCLEGGILAALGVDFMDTMFSKFQCPAYQAVVQYLDNEEINPRHRSPWAWNDDLPYDENGRFVLATRKASREYGNQRVIEVLRACAVIEASREREAVEVSPESVSA